MPNGSDPASGTAGPGSVGQVSVRQRLIELEFRNGFRIGGVESAGLIELEEAPITDLGGIVTGKTPPTAKLDYWGGSIPFVTPTDLNDSPFVPTTSRTVTAGGGRYGYEDSAGLRVVLLHRDHRKIRHHSGGVRK